MSFFSKKITLLFPLSLIFYELPLYLSNTIFLPALPEISKSFQVAHTTTQLSIAFWFLGASIFQIALGPLSDHYGRKKVLLSGGLLFVLATLFSSITHSIVGFLMCRIIQGYASSTVLIAGYAVIHELFDTKQAIKTLSWMGSITILAPALGPLLGSLLLQWMNWRELFMGLAAFTVLTLYFLYVFMPQDRETVEKLNLKKIAINYQVILTNLKFWIYTLLFCFLFSTLIAWNTFSPFYLMDYLKLNRIQFGFIQLFVYGVFILGSNLTRLFIHHLDKVVKIGLFLSIIYFVLSVGILVYLPQDLFLIMVSSLLFFTSTGLIFYSLHRKAIEIPKAPMGTIMAVFSLSKNLSGFLGSFVARTINF